MSQSFLCSDSSEQAQAWGCAWALAPSRHAASPRLSGDSGRGQPGPAGDWPGEAPSLHPADPMLDRLPSVRRRFIFRDVQLQLDLS